MIEQHLHSLISFLSQHPHLGGLIAFIIAFAESLAVVGTIIPGSVTMTAVGVLIGTKVLPAGSTFVWAICGAFTGDFLSYGIGAYYKDRIKTLWPFRKFPKWLAKGEAFFDRHGGKSIIIGRFFGPVRSMIPMIAGILRLSIPRFVLAAIPSATAWAIVYMTPGVLLGALSLELPPGTATKFILYAFLILIIIWLISWLIKHFFKQIWAQIDRSAFKLWHYFDRHRSLHWVTTLLRDPHYPEQHDQLTLVVATLIMLLLFLLIMISVLIHGPLTYFNEPTFHLLRSMYNKPTQAVMVGISMLGSKYVLLPTTVLLTGWFLLQRRWHTAAHWFGVMLLSSLSVFFLKHVTHNPRPGGLMHGPTNYSFPSGHATLSMTLFGFLAMLIAHELPKKQRWIPYCIAGCLVAAVSIARLYLGAHWLTDVLGGAALGLVWILIATISYRRKPRPSVDLKSFIIVIFIIFFTIYFAYGCFSYRDLRASYTPYYPMQVLKLQQWWQQTPATVPLYRTNRLGRPDQALNIQWVGSLKQIKQTLIAQGWKSHPTEINSQNTVYRLSNKHAQFHLPVLPKLYNNTPPILLLTKNASSSKTLIALRLWRSNIEITNTMQPLWIGEVNFREPPHKRFTLNYKKSQHRFVGATNKLINDLSGFTWKLVTIPINQQPQAMQSLHWDGKLLLIKSRKVKQNGKAEDKAKTEE